MGNAALVSLFAAPVLLFMSFHRMWLSTGNGNANYLYFQCLAYGAFVSIFCLEFVGATLRRDKVRRLAEGGLRGVGEMEEQERSEKKRGQDAEREGEDGVGKGNVGGGVDDGSGLCGGSEEGSKEGLAASSAPKANAVFL